MELGIEGKVALVTGGSRGLGRQSALSLAHEGVDVGICGRTQQTLDEAVEEIRAMGVASMGVVADVSDLSAVETLHQRVVEGLGPVDILVNNAGGILSRAEVPALSMEDFKGTFDVNLFGGFQLMKLVIPHMREQRWGRIINFGSLAGRETGSNLSYMSAKAAPDSGHQARGGHAGQGRRAGEQHRSRIRLASRRGLGTLRDREPAGGCSRIH